MNPHDEDLWAHEMSEPEEEHSVRVDPDLVRKTQLLEMLNSLANYIDEGILDYLKDNSLEDYMDAGGFEEDYQNLQAVRRIRAFVTMDEYPWWDSF